MKRFASSKTELAGELGIARQSVYALLKTHGCPKVRGNGKYNISEWRQFLNRIKHTVQDREKNQLTLALMSLKVKKTEMELKDFEACLRDEISAEIREHWKRAINVLAVRLKLLPRDVATKCDGAGAQQIFKVATDLLYQGFDAAQRDFLAHVPEKTGQQPLKVIPFGTEAQAVRAT